MARLGLYNGEGLCLAMGILGRNKGLRPRELVFDFNGNRRKERGITRDDPTLGSGMGSRHPGDPWVVTCGSQPGWVVWVTGNEPPTTRTGTG